ncbi:hypothetical protein SASC598J21_020350 [Snodgrassella alvi SCGC AB-598-J21]|uniref:Uncharacterized protein n=1 Tax=Snodgrassella alvi SCGC AB-598-J21 TaxID=1385367 RepID=A0A074V8E8_9NEIS|nr:hypothetical protein SASC598J21_020350 [Snodgrassella alvi SCGC AB-598-J21]
MNRDKYQIKNSGRYRKLSLWLPEIASNYSHQLFVAELIDIL